MPGTGHSHRYKGSISNRNTKPAFQVLAPWNARKNGEQNQVAVSTGGTNLKFAKMGAKMMSNYNAATDTFAFDCKITAPGGVGGGFSSADVATGSVWLSASSGKIYYESGNVGIGMDNPSATLHVEGTVQMGYLTTASGYSSTAMGQQTTASGNYSTAIGNKAWAGETINFAIGVNNTTPSDSATDISNNNRFVILQNGHVGIGTESSSDDFITQDSSATILNVVGATTSSTYPASTGIAINGTKVIGAQQGGISNVTVGNAANNQGAINEILGALRAHGLIVT